MENKLTDFRPIIVALDFDSKTQALSLVKQLSPQDCRLKVGKQMFTLYGPDFVRTLVDYGFDVFLDLKFHDIPNTVAKAIESAAKLGVWMVNVHACGGLDMIKAANEACKNATKQPLLTCVTVLTSMDATQFASVYPNEIIEQKVASLALLSEEGGADGVVCSAQEAKMLRQTLGNRFKLVTPGIRPAGSNNDDQKRIMTPVEAKRVGVDYMVIGRPITKSNSPVTVLNAINKSINCP